MFRYGFAAVRCFVGHGFAGRGFAGRGFAGHCAVVACLALGSAAYGAEPKLKGLLVTGGCCHDYEAQKKIISEGLAQRASIKFDIVHEGGTSTDHKVSVYSNPNWAKGYDVIVHNECFASVNDEPFIKGIIKAHTDGVPAVFIHCAMHSYRDVPGTSDLWRELIGVTTRSHEGHRSEAVKTVNAEHPVMQGFPAKWDTPNGELYIIEKLWPNCVPLAQAFGPDTNAEHTVAWVNTLGKTKVFGTTLGHHNETMNSPEWLGLVSRGTLWAVGQLNDDGTPRTGYEGTGVAEIKLGSKDSPNIPLAPAADPLFVGR